MALIDNLISYYKLDENAANTTVNDAESINDLTASTNTSNLFNASGLINSAFDFTAASSEHAKISSNLGVSSYPFSFSCWFKNTSGTNQGLVEFADDTANRNYGMDIDVNKIRMLIRSTGSGTVNTAGTTTVTDGNWHHAVMVFFDSDTFTLYLDGETGTPEIVEDGTEVTLTTNSFAIARHNDSTPSSYNDGLIDEVGVWDKALSTSETTQLYNSGNGIAYPFTAGWSGKIQGITPSKVQGIDVANISKIQGVA